MFTHKTIALALASALIFAGCATTAWQRPPHHPADPDAKAGITPAVTALDRYRRGTADVTATEGSTGKDGDTDHSGHQHEEAQP